MTNEPKQPAALEVVAWLEPDSLPLPPTFSCLVYASAGPRHWKREPLVPLSEAEEALQQAALRCVSLFGELQRSIEENEALRTEVAALRADGERYQLLRRGQYWSVINGIGDTLRAEELDAAIDSALALAAKEAKQ